MGWKKILLEGDAGGGANHDILDGSVHQDSVADAVTRGSLIYGNSTPKWDELVVGAANSVLWTDGTDVSWSAAPRLANIADTGGTNRIDLNTSSPHVEINDDFQVEGVMGVKGSTLNAKHMIDISPTMTVGNNYWYGINIQPTLTMDASARTVTGVLGVPNLRWSGNVNNLTVRGLYFAGAGLDTSMSSGQTASFATVEGVYASIAITGMTSGATTNIGNMTVFHAVPIFNILGFLGASGTAIQVMGMHIEDTNSSNVTNWTGLRIDAETAATGNKYGIHVLGGGTYAIFSDAGLNRFDGNGTHVFELPADATAGTTAISGRIPVKISGATRYIHYHTS